jgi:hypothetical protein
MDFQAYAVRELTTVADKLADTAKKQLEAATAQLTANFDTTIDRLRHDQSELVNENERLTAENAALSWEKDQMIEAAKTASRGPLIDRLEDVFERIGSSTTVDAALLAAASGLVGDFTRVAVFAGDRRLAQLGADTPPIDPAAAAVAAFPIVVRGETLATIVAAEETRAGGEGARLAGVLRRHVVLALERLTIELKAVGELRAYAQMLLDEVEYVFNADTTASLNGSERRERLSENLRCARQIYGQRVTLEGPAAASVLDEVLSRMLDAKAETAFGRELAEVATAPQAAQA